MTSYQELIEVAELKRIVLADTVRVIDCRFDLKQPEKGRLDYQAGHVPGAVFADLDKDLAGPVSETSGRHPLPSGESFAGTLGNWGIDENTQVVVYDQGSGALAARLWWMFRWMGHLRVALLNGGLNAWQNAGESLETSVPEYQATHVRWAPRGALAVAVEEVVDSMTGRSGMVLVDARDRARFAGEVEPIDPVAGHVPGALNFPVGENLLANGQWKSREELRKTWRELLAGQDDAPVVAMCGSGVTACHLVLSAVRAGIDEPRVYIGSWSEWIRDPSRPRVPDEQAPA